METQGIMTVDERQDGLDQQFPYYVLVQYTFIFLYQQFLMWYGRIKILDKNCISVSLFAFINSPEPKAHKVSL